MKEVRKIFKSEKWVNRILFISIFIILAVFVAALPVLANGPGQFIFRPINPVNYSYGYGYSQDSITGYGYGVFGGVREGWGYGRYRYQNIPHKTHPNGTLVKMPISPLVFVVDEGHLRWIISPTAFESWGWNWNDIVTISLDEVATYNGVTVSGGGITITTVPILLRPGTLVKAPTDPKVYLVNFDGYLHWISTPTLFERMGFRWEDIRTFINPDEINWYTVGSRYVEADPGVGSGYIVYNGQLPDGSLIKGSGAEVYMWTPRTLGSINWVYSPVAFESWGFNWASIRQVPDTDIAWYLYWDRGQDLLAKPGTLIKDSTAPVYVTDYLMQDDPTAGASWGSYIFKKRWISSESKFTSLGYKWENIKTVPTTEVNLYADATEVK